MFNQLNCLDWLQNKKPTSGNSFNCGNPILSETHCIQNSDHTFSLDIALLTSSSLTLLPFSFGNMSCKRNSYPANFKLQVIAFSVSTNNSMPARHFSVNEKLVRDWRKQQNALFEMLKGKKATRGHWPMYPELEERLAAWIKESCSQGLIITCTAICIRALKLIKTP